MAEPEHLTKTQVLSNGEERKRCIDRLSSHDVATGIILNIFDFVLQDVHVAATTDSTMDAVAKEIDFFLCGERDHPLRGLVEKSFWENAWIDLPFGWTVDGRWQFHHPRSDLAGIQTKIQNLCMCTGPESVFLWQTISVSNWLRLHIYEWLGGEDALPSLKAIRADMRIFKPKDTTTPDLLVKGYVEAMLQALQSMPYKTSAVLRLDGGKADEAAHINIGKETSAWKMMEQLFACMQGFHSDKAEVEDEVEGYGHFLRDESEPKIGSSYD